MSQLRTEALTLMRAGIESQYVEEPAGGGRRPTGAARRHAPYVAQLAARSTYATRLSLVPAQRSGPGRRDEVRVSG